MTAQNISEPAAYRCVADIHEYRSLARLGTASHEARRSPTLRSNKIVHSSFSIHGILW